MKILPAFVREYENNIKEVEGAFNAASDRLGLGVKLCAANLIKATKSGRNVRKIQTFSSTSPGRLHVEQVQTVVECITRLVDSPYNFGLVLGALQSGKTATGLALQFACVAYYLIIGKPLCPLYLTTSQNSHAEQLGIDLAYFIKYYGDLDVIFAGNRCRLRNYIARKSINPFFELSPNLDTYREVVLGGVAQNSVLSVATQADLIHKRVQGGAKTDLTRQVKKILNAGAKPLLIIDEPQFGASDRLVKKRGQPTVIRPCLLTQFETALQAEIGLHQVQQMKFIGLSATPFELHELTRVWTVKQNLNSAYRGYDYFGGKPIDPSVNITPPNSMSMTDAGKKFNLPFLPSISSAAFSTKRSFNSWRQNSGFVGSWEDYQHQCLDSTRELILDLINRHSENDQKIGICLRAINDNNRTNDFLRGLRLPKNSVDIVKFFGHSGRGLTVKQAIKNRARPDLPFLFLVTSKARMGDQFPASVQYFIEFARRASDLNSLLQGLVGRACGYGKNSHIILSDDNKKILDGWVATHGDYVTKPSRHSVVAGGSLNLAQKQQLTITRDPCDTTLEPFFAELDAKIVSAFVPPGPKMAPRKSGKGGRRGPILTIAESHKTFDHVESRAFRTTLLSHVFGSAELVRRGDSITMTEPSGVEVQARYLLDAQGRCRFNFRHHAYAGRGGLKGRGLGQRDSMNATLNLGVLEPSLGLRKVDAATGDFIDDDTTPGVWVAVSVTFPLKTPILMSPKRARGHISLPGEHCVYAKQMTPQERAHRGF